MPRVLFVVDFGVTFYYIAFYMSQDATTEEKKIAAAQEMADDFDFSDLDVAGANVSEDLLLEMVRAGLWYGRNKRKTHPKMKPYIFTNRNGIEIINLAKTATILDDGVALLKEVLLKGGQVLFVGTQPSAKAKTEEVAQRLKQPFVVNRWLGGTLTNFTTLSKRVEYFKKLKADRVSGVLDKYTKKERSDFNKEIDRLSTLFSGIENMPKLPGAVFLINAKIHNTAIREANKMKIPVVGLISTDADPDYLTYPVPGNDLSPSSINWVLNRIEQALQGVSKTQTEEAKKVLEELPAHA